MKLDLEQISNIANSELVKELNIKEFDLLTKKSKAILSKVKSETDKYCEDGSGIVNIDNLKKIQSDVIDAVGGRYNEELSKIKKLQSIANDASNKASNYVNKASDYANSKLGGLTQKGDSLLGDTSSLYDKGINALTGTDVAIKDKINGAINMMGISELSIVKEKQTQLAVLMKEASDKILSAGGQVNPAQLDVLKSDFMSDLDKKYNSSSKDVNDIKNNLQKKYLSFLGDEQSSDKSVLDGIMKSDKFKSAASWMEKGTSFLDKGKQDVQSIYDMADSATASIGKNLSMLNLTNSAAEVSGCDISDSFALESPCSLISGDPSAPPVPAAPGSEPETLSILGASEGAAEMCTFDLYDNPVDLTDVSSITNAKKNSTEPTAEIPTPSEAKPLAPTYGHEKQWDNRLGFAHHASHNLGNSFKGTRSELTKGSPALMNEMALIYFGHIAGSNHHKYIIDQEGSPNFGMAGSTVKYASLNDPEMKNVTVKTGSENEVDKSTLPDEYSKYKSGSGNVYQNKDNGSIYTEADDLTVEIWISDKLKEPKNKIVVNASSTAKNHERPGLSGVSNMKISKEDVDTYWKKKLNWIECDSNGKIQMVPTKKDCTLAKDKIEGKKSSIEQTPEMVAESKAKVDEATAAVATHLAENWKFEKHGTKQIPIKRLKSSATTLQSLEPSFENLCSDSNWPRDPQFLYQWRHFLYTTHYKFIPNNRMITLRRFPMPTFDSGKVFGSDKTGEYQMPFAVGVTWFGSETGTSLTDLLGMSFGFAWKDVDAMERQDGLDIEGNEQAADEGPMGTLSKALILGKAITGTGKSVQQRGKEEQLAQNKELLDPLINGKYANAVLGPVNRVSKVKVRDAGVNYEQSMTINFSYDLKSIGGVNPKAAMLDIMANMLALTYADTEFYGGEYRYFANSPVYPFLGGKEAQEAFYSGDPGKYIEAIQKTITSSLGDIMRGFKEVIKDGGKKLLKGLAQAWMAKNTKSRPNLIGLRSLLTGNPTGEWHLMVGNPFNPIAMMGNMVVTNVEMSFSEILGADDFPNTIKFAVTLEHAMPRGKGDIESIFNKGLGKMHYAYQCDEGLGWNTSFSSTDGRGHNAQTGGKATSIGADGNKKINITKDTMNTTENMGDQTGGDVGSHVSAVNASYKKAYKLAEQMGQKSMGE